VLSGNEQLSRIVLQHNIHASPLSRTHMNTWDMHNGLTSKWLHGLAPGDVVQIFPRAAYSGWRNTVESAEIEIACAWR
jgi:hypothetical protein